MNAAESSNKQARVLGFVRPLIHVLGLFWINGLVLVLFIIIGLIMGLSTPRQWSDGAFIAGGVQILIAASWLFGSEADLQNASLMRYVPGGDVTASTRQMAAEMFRKGPLGLRIFIGGVVTLLLAWLILAFK